MTISPFVIIYMILLVPSVVMAFVHLMHITTVSVEGERFITSLGDVARLFHRYQVLQVLYVLALATVMPTVGFDVYVFLILFNALVAASGDVICWFSNKRGALDVFRDKCIGEITKTGMSYGYPDGIRPRCLIVMANMAQVIQYTAVYFLSFLVYWICRWIF